MELSLPTLLRAARIAANMERLFRKASYRNANPFSKPICLFWETKNESECALIETDNGLSCNRPRPTSPLM